MCRELESAQSGMTSELERHWAAEDEILQMHAEMEQTNVQLKEAANRIASLKSQVGSLNDRNSELENRLENIQGTHDDAIKNLYDSRQELLTKNDEIQQLQEVAKHEKQQLQLKQ